MLSHIGMEGDVNVCKVLPVKFYPIVTVCRWLPAKF